MAPIAMEVCSIKGYWPVLRLEVWKSPLLGFICRIKALKCYSWKYLFSHHLITSPHLLGTLENMHNCSSNRWESVSTQINLESHHTAVAAATVVEHIQQYITSQSYLLHTYAIISVVVLVVVGVLLLQFINTPPEAAAAAGADGVVGGLTIWIDFNSTLSSSAVGRLVYIFTLSLMIIGSSLIIRFSNSSGSLFWKQACLLDVGIYWQKPTEPILHYIYHI